MIERQPPDAPYQLPPGSRIRVNERDGGAEFYFPAARNLSTVFGLMAFTLVWSGFVAAFFVLDKPGFLSVVFTAFDAALVLLVANLLTRSSRVFVEPAGVTVNSGWLFLRSVKKFSADEIDIIVPRAGMTSGQTTFYNIKVVTRAEGDVTAGNNVPDQPTAEWLAAEMRRHLKSDVPFDPRRAATQMHMTVLDRPDGGREFIFPLARNFSLKLGFSMLWLVLTAMLAGFAFLNAQFINQFPMPGIIRFIVINHTYYIMGFLGLFELVLTLACADMWLRSSRIIATPGRLRAVTHWLFFKRTVEIAAANILEIRVFAATTINETIYYDLVVLSVGEKPGWVAKNFPAQKRADSSFTDNDLKSFNSGGKKIAVATGIKDKMEADWLAVELQRVMKG